MQKIIEKLNNEFSLEEGENSLRFVNSVSDIPVVEINNQYASAKISLQGAHVLSWKPVNEDEVIWLSEDASYTREKSIRGGIPLCWPWFGAAEISAEAASELSQPLPAHGFARTVFWQVLNTAQLENGETEICFKLDTTTLSINTEELWPHATTATYRVTIGKTLRLDLITLNNSHECFTLGQALHTYFNVSEISKVQINGLQGKEYLDKPSGFSRNTQTEQLDIIGEVDRIYLDTEDTVTIKDLTRSIVINKQGSHSTVVWNPGEMVAHKMGDLGKQGYKKMLCVESANAAEDTVTLDPGKSHTLSVTYKVTHE